MTMPLPTFRFAPSPNGRLHLGHAYSALLNQKWAQHLRASMLLRMEDIDTTRCNKEFATQCIHDLTWLGFSWSGTIRTQSEHFEDYKAAAQHLKSRGLLYPCFCSRSDIAHLSTEKDPDGAPLYPGTCRHVTPAQSQAKIQAGEAHSWRLHIRRALFLHPGPHHYNALDTHLNTKTIQVNPACWGDAIIVRKDIPSSYHLSVVLDDALQQVTHIVRGKDLEAATDLHVLLQALLKLPTPLYHHHALISDNGKKLSKSAGSETIDELRKAGMTPDDIHDLLFPAKSA